MTTTDPRPHRHPVLQRWPAALGLAAALVLLATGVADRDTLAITVLAAAVCYLAAAAFDRRWVAWAAILGGSAVVTIGRLLDAPAWIALGLAALVLVVVGLVGGAPRAALGAQAAALLGYGGVATVATVLSPDAGLVVVGLTLAAHGVWDVVHLRRDAVVARSLAEACVWLDVPLGLGVLVLAAA